MKDYYKDQLQQLLVNNEPDSMQLKITGSKIATKHLNINAESIEAIEEFFNVLKPALTKASNKKALYLFTCFGGFNQEFATSEEEAWEKFKITAGGNVEGWKISDVLTTEKQWKAYWDNTPLFD